MCIMSFLTVPESYTMIAESKFQVCKILFLCSSIIDNYAYNTNILKHRCLWRFSLISYCLMVLLALWMITTKNVVIKVGANLSFPYP